MNKKSKLRQEFLDKRNKKICDLYNTGNCSQTDLEKQFGLSRKRIFVILGKNKKNLVSE